MNSMVNTAYMYKTYKAEIRKEVNVLREEIKKLKLTKTKFKKVILSNKEVLLQNENLSLSMLHKDTFYIEGIELLDNAPDSTAYISLHSSLRGIFSIVAKCIKRIAIAEVNIADLKRNIVTYEIFTKVLSMNNDAIIENVVKGEVHTFGKSIGSIYIKKKECYYSDDTNDIYNSMSNNINWGKSRKQRQYLLDNGKLPLAYYKDDDGNITGDNGGEAWIIYNTDTYNYWFIWNNKISKIPNYTYYSFVPSGYNNEPNTTEEMKTMSIGDELFDMKLGAYTKANIYRNINPSVKSKYIK